MGPIDLARLQFALTTIFHFFFVPLTMGLSLLVAIFQTAWHRTQNPVYLRMTRFWGKLFLINFAIGVVTGIVQEFQFGMNWSAYSRFVGDIFGAPLAIEGLAAFFLESTFLGLWIFGWNRLSPRVHLFSIWMVAIGTWISAFWILLANSWMQHPVGYTVNQAAGRAELTDFAALVANPTLWVAFPHTILAAVATAAFFVLGISAYHLLRKRETEVFGHSARIALVAGLIAAIGVAFTGHLQAQVMTKQQPMKMAAAESLFETQDGAEFSIFAIGDLSENAPGLNITVPHLLSVLADNTWNGRVLGITDIEAAYQQRYGPGSYRPIVWVAYWTFRIMVGAGFLMIFLALYGLWKMRKGTLESGRRFLWLLPLALFLPYIANTTGWIFTEMGRQPWIVFGLEKTADAASPTVGTALVATTVIGFTLIYGALMAVDVWLMVRFAKAGPPDVDAS
ncbi:MAG: cytochrome ubiquinol oxidase subunit I, partial [Planctomycetaceae bacterium]